MITHIEQDEIEGENVYSEGWNPSQEQFNRYLAREVEMCKKNIAFARNENSERNFTKDNESVVLLHSWSTALEAVSDIRVERRPIVTDGSKPFKC